MAVCGTPAIMCCSGWMYCFAYHFASMTICIRIPHLTCVHIIGSTSSTSIWSSMVIFLIWYKSHENRWTVGSKFDIARLDDWLVYWSFQAVEYSICVCVNFDHHAFCPIRRLIGLSEFSSRGVCHFRLCKFRSSRFFMPSDWCLSWHIFFHDSFDQQFTTVALW